MITRKLVAALVALSLAAGTLGVASAATTAPTAQTTAPVQSASPSDAAAPSAATKADTTVKAAATKTPVSHRSHRTSMKAKLHRKHVAHRTGTRSARLANKNASRRIHVSHNGKHGAPKHG